MIKYNKKGWVARDYVIASLIFSVGIALFFIMVNSASEEYQDLTGVSIVNNSFNSSFNKFTETTEKASSIYQSVKSGDGLDFIEASELVFKSGLVIIGIILDSLVITTGQVLSFGNYFGIPNEITSIFSVFIIAVITVSLVFIIINSIRGGKEL